MMSPAGEIPSAAHYLPLGSLLDLPILFPFLLLALRAALAAAY